MDYLYWDIPMIVPIHPHNYIYEVVPPSSKSLYPITATVMITIDPSLVNQTELTTLVTPNQMPIFFTSSRILF
jgi:hypothetical protein